MAHGSMLSFAVALLLLAQLAHAQDDPCTDVSPTLPGRRTKTYLYVLAGPARPSRFVADFVATLEASAPATCPTFGSTLSVTSIPTRIGWANEPHHVGLSRDGSILAAGGLFSYYKKPPFLKIREVPDLYFFNLSDPARPRFQDAAFGIQGAVADTFIPLGTELLPDGDPAKGFPRFLVTFMGSRSGARPGRLAEVRYTGPNRQFEVHAEFPGGLGGTVDPAFTPHGTDRNGPNGTILVTADYVDASTTWAGAGPPRWGQTVRVWDLSAWVQGSGPPVVTAVWDLGLLADQIEPGKPTLGLMSVRWTGVGGLFYFSAGLGQVYLLNTSIPAGGDVNQAVRRVYSLLPGQNLEGSCVFSAIFNSPATDTVPAYRRVFVTSLALNAVRILDITDLANPITLDTFQLPARSEPHVVVTNAPATLLATSTYYVDQGPGAVWSTPGERKVQLFRITDGNGAPKSKLVSLTSVAVAPNPILPVPAGRQAPGRPHGILFRTVTLP